MSVHAISWAFRIRTPSATAKLVLLALANYADEDGVAWPSVARIAGETGLGDRAVRYAIRDLIEAGLLSKESRRRSNGSRTSDEYTLFQQAAPNAVCAPDKRHVVHSQAAPGAYPTSFEPSEEPSPICALPTADDVWALQPVINGKRRSTRPDVRAAWQAALKRKADPVEMLRACTAYFDLPANTKDSGQFAMGAARLLQADRWRDFLSAPAAPSAAQPLTAEGQAKRLRHYRDTGEWRPAWGPIPQAAAATPTDDFVKAKL